MTLSPRFDSLLRPGLDPGRAYFDPVFRVKFGRLMTVIFMSALFMIGLALAPRNLYAADARAIGSDLGVLGGIGDVNQGVGTHLDLGLTGHVQIFPMLNVGFYYQYYWNNYSSVGTTHNHLLAAEANYLFSGMLDGFYAGGKVGLQMVGNSAPNTQSSTDLALGPAVGYDYPIADKLSFGGQVNLLFVTQNPLLTNYNLVALLKLNF